MHERNGYFTNCEIYTAKQMKIVIHFSCSILHRIREININNKWFYADEKILIGREKLKINALAYAADYCTVKSNAVAVWFMKRQPRHKNIKEARILSLMNIFQRTHALRLVLIQNILREYENNIWSECPNRQYSAAAPAVAVEWNVARN